MADPYFFRVDAGKLLDFATDSENSRISLVQFAKDLTKCKSDIPFIQSLIEEARNFSNKKSLAGKKGMSSRYSKPNTDITVLNSVITEPNTDITNSSNNKEKKKRKEKPSPEIKDLVLPEWLPEEIVSQFVEHRIQKKKPMTDLAMQMMVKYLDGVRKDYDVVKLLETAIRCNWLSVVLKDECKIVNNKPLSPKELFDAQRGGQPFC